MRSTIKWRSWLSGKKKKMEKKMCVKSRQQRGIRGKNSYDFNLAELFKMDYSQLFVGQFIVSQKISVHIVGIVHLFENVHYHLKLWGL